MRAAFDALDPAAQAKLEDLTAYHSAQYSSARKVGYFPPGEGNVGKYGPGPKEFPAPKPQVKSQKALSFVRSAPMLSAAF